ncbi:hypothetical protein QTA57_12670 [Fontisubflavum oceani]|uniref:hypothetical protein n=1 Tax=Fontisubflavum oceani TaxID=2978973 RepID=UPI0025B37D15|nr:hypothetical protein [Fontisubflavum oceani]WJY20678.1 hypothetical protein QTA57_12670 [Fontisubflavum oceani]
MPWSKRARRWPDGAASDRAAARPDAAERLDDGAFPTFRVTQQIDGRDPLLAHGGDMPLFGGFFEGDGPDVAIQDASGQLIMTSAVIADLVTYLQNIQE